ncbi:hypothetical protein ILUMI_02484 [Ignelater luminosus]|uniref:RNA-directed DNA polymerase n=1 Tax=Ignelater luminosus TaxID=2038154 RepID=A0A8K0GKS9_IGNLU|nr:hypothetical protein ILUMI_02484 [Ignelater luminosus]
MEGHREMERLNIEGTGAEISTRWRKWLRAFNLYISAKGITDNARKKSYLLHYAGMEVQEIYFTLENTFVAEQPAAGAGATISEACVVTFEEAVTLLNAHFSPRLRQQAELCNFDTTDEHIRNQVIEKCVSSELRKKFLQEGTTLTLTKMMEISRLFESIEQQAKHMEGAVGEVNRITTSKMHQQRCCYRCNKVGHYAKDKNCPAKNATCRKYDIKIYIGGVETSVLIDSGATCNILNGNTWNSLKQNKIKCKTELADVKIQGYSQNRNLKVLGKVTAELQIKSGRVENNVVFYVIKDGERCLLGRTTAIKLGLLKIGPEVNHVHVHQLHIPLNNEITPVIQPLRRVPIALQEKADKKLQQMELDDIIEKVEHPTNWVSSMVIIPKLRGEIRLCIDMRRANLRQGKIFSKLDIKDAFYQIELAPESRDVTTFITPKGLYRFKRLMFCITCAPEMYQRIIQQVLQKCEGTINYIDDILIYASNEKEHEIRLNKVLDVLEQKGLTLNQKKCIFGKSLVTFMGHILSEKGIQPLESKIEAIESFRQPQTKEEVRSFLGLVNYVGKFIPDLATTTEPLRRLIRQDVHFKWTRETERAFEKLKKQLVTPSVLGYFDPEKKTQLITDASPVALAGVLVQYDKNNKPSIISYGSKSLTEQEKRYSQTEKEALAIVWACEKFKIYLIGIKFELITDHKPLEVIYSVKSKPCARIERWVLRLQSFNYTVKYKSGKSNIADCLSRLISIKTAKPFDPHAEEYIHNIIFEAKPKALSLRTIEQATKKDGEIQRIKTSLNSNRCQEEDRACCMIKDELCTMRNILLRGTRIVIPQSLRQLVVKLGHEGHPGMMKMEGILRTKVWWPKMNQAVESITANNGKAFVATQFSEFCEEHGIQLNHTTPLWLQANGEVERQNRSLLKVLRIASNTGKDWKEEMLTYLTMYRNAPHSTMGTSPSEIMFQRKLRGKLSELNQERNDYFDEEIRDRDWTNKMKGKEYTDQYRNTRESSIQNGDQVLVQQPKLDKFTTVFQSTSYKVVNRRGTQVEVMSPEGVCCKRNTSKLKKYYGNDDIPVTQASEKTHHEDVQVEHDPIRRESSMEPKEEGNEEERSVLSARSPARLQSHPSRTRQPPKWLLDYDQN